MPGMPERIAAPRESHADQRGDGERDRPHAKHEADPPLLLIETTAGVQRIVHACGRCRSAGVRNGMTLAHARALCDRNVEVEPVDEAGDREALQRLAVWAMQFSPVVAVDEPAGLKLDITGCQRLFHGERRLVNLVGNRLERIGLSARVAAASTVGCAWATARYGPGDRTIVAAGDEPQAMAPLPIESLRIEPDAAEGLREVGIEAVGELLALPRLELVARFGADVLRRIDQALGETDEVIDPIRPAMVMEAERRFAGPVKQLEAIRITVRELVEDLVERLREVERGATAVRVRFERSDDEPVERAVTTSRPSRDAKHLQSLLEPVIERVPMGFGIERIELRANATERMTHEQAAWAEDGDAATANEAIQAMGRLVDALASRMGRSRVLTAALCDAHGPERTFVRAPAGADSALWRNERRAEHDADEEETDWAGAVMHRLPRPSCVFDRPERVIVQMRPGNDEDGMDPNGARPEVVRWRGVALAVVRWHGPERIDDAWWEDGEGDRPGHGASRERSRRRGRPATLGARDYFAMQEAGGRWLWIYRRRTLAAPGAVRTKRGERWDGVAGSSFEDDDAPAGGEAWFIHGVWA